MDNILYHFTAMKKEKDTNESILQCADRGFKNLLGILENGFRFNLHAVTPIVRTDSTFTYSPDMICFTETALSKLPHLDNKFGFVGIGMKQAWIEKIGGQPILYTLPTSMIEQALLKFDSAMGVLCNKTIEDQEFKYIKNELFNSFDAIHAVTQPYRHAIEKEWRILRNKDNENQKLKISYSKDTYDIKDYLKFGIEDIALIVVPYDYISNIKEELTKIFSIKHSELLLPIVPYEYIEKF